MAATETRYKHIVHAADGVPFISGTTMKVVELVLDQLAHGWSAEELHFQHPDLSLGQIHSALAYYWDHRDELDNDIAARRERVKQIKRSTPAAPLIRKLKKARS